MRGLSSRCALPSQWTDLPCAVFREDCGLRVSESATQVNNVFLAMSLENGWTKSSTALWGIREKGHERRDHLFGERFSSGSFARK